MSLAGRLPLGPLSDDDAALQRADTRALSGRAARGTSTSVVVGAVVGAIVLIAAGILGVLLYRRHRRMRPKYIFEEPSMLEDKKGHSGTNGTSGTNGAHTTAPCDPGSDVPTHFASALHCEA